MHAVSFHVYDCPVCEISFAYARPSHARVRIRLPHLFSKVRWPNDYALFSKNQRATSNLIEPRCYEFHKQRVGSGNCWRRSLRERQIQFLYFITCSLQSFHRYSETHDWNSRIYRNQNTFSNHCLSIKCKQLTTHGQEYFSTSFPPIILTSFCFEGRTPHVSYNLSIIFELSVTQRRCVIDKWQQTSLYKIVFSMHVECTAMCYILEDVNMTEPRHVDMYFMDLRFLSVNNCR